MKILFPGNRNNHAGPDFTGARIRIGQLVWVGNVEVHARSGDWVRHGHHLNPAYNNVILHVAGFYEGETLNASGLQVPTLLLQVPDRIRSRITFLMREKESFPCLSMTGGLPGAFPWDWIRLLGKVRMEQRASLTRDMLATCALSREDAMYRILARGFGIPVNTLPFEWLSSRVPLPLLRECRDSLFDLESVLFGQAGLLNSGTCREPYLRTLESRFGQLRKYLGEEAIGSHLWRYLRLRPASFPTVRIAQFASLIHHRLPFKDSLLEARTLTELQQLLRVRASEFWDTHYRFGKVSPPSPKYVGSDTANMLVINSVIPYLQARGEAEKRNAFTGRAEAFLHEVKAESNQIIKKWVNFGVNPKNAWESQGLIQLHQCYCIRKNCTCCNIGRLLLTESIDETP